MNEADKALGLYKKWDVRRLHDPEAKHDHCELFVLDLTHDPFAAEAALWYADQCQAEYPNLARDLVMTVMQSDPQAVMRHMERLHEMAGPFRFRTTSDE